MKFFDRNVHIFDSDFVECIDDKDIMPIDKSITTQTSRTLYNENIGSVNTLFFYFILSILLKKCALKCLFLYVFFIDFSGVICDNTDGVSI